MRKGNFQAAKGPLLDAKRAGFRTRKLPFRIVIRQLLENGGLQAVIRLAITSKSEANVLCCRVGVGYWLFSQRLGHYEVERAW